MERTLNILVVDDEVSLCKIIAQALQFKKFSTSTAFDGEEGFRLASSQNFDVVISDIQMPKCTGVELLERLMTFKNKIQLIILISGFSDYTEEELLKKGADLFFSKPISAIEITNAINSRLKK